MKTTVHDKAELRRCYPAATFLLGIALGMGVCAEAFAAAALNIVQHGRSDYSILIAADAAPPERFAAEELQRYLNRMTGVELPVVTRGEGPVLSVGQTAAAAAVDVAPMHDADDSLRVRTVGANIIIKGASPRGTLFGAYALLERLGCRFWAPGTEVLEGHHEHVPPPVPTLVIPELDLHERPRMKYRKREGDVGELTLTAQTWPAVIDWAAKNRYNVIGRGIRQYEAEREAILPEIRRRGLMLHVGQHDVVDHFLPSAKYFAEHPEWYGQIDKKRVLTVQGKNVPLPVMFDTANEQAVSTLVGGTVAYLRQRPEIETFQIWPPDSCVWSTSAESKALGTPPQRMGRLVRQVSEAVRAEGLPVRVSFPAYQNYLDPPADMSFDPRTIVEFCPIGQDHSKPIDAADSPRNARYDAQLRAWTNRFPGEVIHYSYYAKYSWRSLPLVVPHQIAHEVAYWRKAGEVGAGIYTEPGNWLALEANQLALGRALWDEKFDPETWYARYLQERFGNAAAAMRRFQETATRISLGALIAESATRDPKALADFEPLVAEARRHMEQARREADTPAARRLIDKLAWQADYVQRAYAVRRAFITKAPPAELQAAKAAVRALVEPHLNDGTYLNWLGPYPGR